MNAIETWAVGILAPIALAYGFGYMAKNSEMAGKFIMKWLLAHDSAGKILREHMAQINDAADGFVKGLKEGENNDAPPPQPPQA